MVAATTGPVLTVDDEERFAEIRSMKLKALLVLLAATVVFVVARVLEARSGAGWGYLRATAEAAMVGGLADWFAVTALFRHPLGIPIPHTAILPNRKDQLGKTLGSFVQTSFLSPDVLAERLRDADVSGRVAAWLREPGNPELVSEKLSSLAITGLRLLDDDAVSDLVTTDLLGRLRDVDLAPMLGQALTVATEDGRHHRLVDAALAAAADAMAKQRPTLRRRFEAETPWWLPPNVEERVFERGFAAMQSFIAEVRRTPTHSVRRHLDERLADLALRLQESPELAATVATARDEMLDHPAVRTWATELWREVRDGFIQQAGDPESSLRRRVADGALAVAHALETDAELAGRVDHSTLDIVTMLAARYGDEVAGFVESTVQRWDATETSTRIELLLGRDLQIIRINGSLVGGLAGLIIHAVGNLLG